MTEQTTPRECPATEAQLVAVPVKYSWKSREAWLFFVSGVLVAILSGLQALPPEMLAAVAWLPAVIKTLTGLSAVAGFFVRLSRPDLVTGVPWLDRSTTSALVVPPKAGSGA